MKKPACAMLVFQWKDAIRTEMCWNRRAAPKNSEDQMHLVAKGFIEDPKMLEWIGLFGMMDSMNDGESEMFPFLETVAECGAIVGLNKNLSEYGILCGRLKADALITELHENERASSPNFLENAESYNHCWFYGEKDDLSFDLPPPDSTGDDKSKYGYSMSSRLKEKVRCMSGLLAILRWHCCARMNLQEFIANLFFFAKKLTKKG